MRKLMKLPPQERIKELYHYDPLTGVFTRKVDRHSWKAGDIAGTLSCGYISISIDYKVYRAHRLAWVYMTGREPQHHIDHINGNKTDNRWSNLREATQAENVLNRKMSCTNKSGHKGIWQRKSGRYTARVEMDGVRKNLGTYSTKEEAKAAYDAAAKILHGEFFKS